MTRFLILIHGDESRWDSMSTAERDQIDAAHRVFAERAGESVVAAGQLESSSRAARLRDIADGVPVLTDGPFTESGEVIGGFYVVEAPDRDTAIDLAAGLAEVAHDHSWVEVWPLVDHGEG